MTAPVSNPANSSGEFQREVRWSGSEDPGGWRGKYGASGYEVVGRATLLPAGVQVDWSGGAPGSGQSPRTIFAPAAQDAARVAACRYAGQLTLQVELPDKERRLSLYYVDWDRRRAKQTFTLWSEDGTQLDRREVEKATMAAI